MNSINGTVIRPATAAAEPAGNGAVGPGTVVDLADLIEIGDLQVGVPEPAFLGRKPPLDGGERAGLVARRQLGIEARAEHIGVLFKPVRGVSRRDAPGEAS